MDTMRILSNGDVEQVFDVGECMAALETAYRELALGQGANRPRNHTYFPAEDPDHPGFRFRFKSQEGGTVTSGVWALRITSDMAGVEVLAGGVRRRRLLPLATGDTYCGLITLYSMRHLEPLAIIHDSYIQKMRVGATTALGIRELANPDVRLAGLFGSGWQAQAHVEYLLRVRPSIEEVRVYSPTQAHREEFARTWSAKTGKRIVAVDEPRGAVQDCQVVVCATAGFDPCFDGAWLAPGTHVTSITSPDGTAMRRELDDTTFDRADVITVLSREQVGHDNQIDIMGPVQRGLKSFDDIADLGSLLLGKAAGRTSPEQITIFANNTGMGLQFAAVGAYVLAKCEELGLGHTVPTPWFLEETSP
jgi:ornithine cyclodeaminase/alanine dehydrogenase-like protein (mu-crystallin family)